MLNLKCILIKILLLSCNLFLRVFHLELTLIDDLKDSLDMENRPPFRTYFKVRDTFGVPSASDQPNTSQHSIDVRPGKISGSRPTSSKEARKLTADGGTKGKSKGMFELKRQVLETKLKEREIDDLKRQNSRLKQQEKELVKLRKENLELKKNEKAMTELEKRTTALRSTVVELETTLEHLRCKICFNNTVDTMFLPCLHLVTCGECTAALMKNPAGKNCPLCRGLITSTKHVFT